ncbi:M20/M25/M40 family metallo-hydrolase [Paracoccus onubensis]|uniref:M20 family metallopeptidase n=1 Tax=Paracoccus onubensis TaxID=1675788 RepID=UPI002730B2CF|nr:M20/M25/M40 family metallo-hydrolase [Paracoccus onubensis]MDP0930310.1 M20/M25/M40 family metallo-hydrolase [Paracoccus onubensis]
MIAMVSPLEEAIDEAILSERNSLFRLCGDLVAEPSASPPGHTAGVARIVARYLASQGIDSSLVAAEKDAPNIVAEVHGKLPGRHVVFNAHMDTMQPGNEALWTVPIRETTSRDGRLYGLGMGNMKGALAAMLVATAVLKRHADSLHGRLSFTAVCDEVMFGERGAVFLLNARPDLKGDVLISGEGPGYMDLAVAEKGLLWIDLSTQGSGGHSSNAKRGNTPISRLCECLRQIDEFNDIFASVPEAIAGTSGGIENAGFRLSANAGIVVSGGVRSLIANLARAELDFRLPPGITIDDVQNRIRAITESLEIEMVARKGWNANWTALNSELVQTVARTVEGLRGKAPGLVVRLPGSDARRWRDLGTPAICYGPQPELSAGIDDFAFEQDVLDCARVYARSAIHLLKMDNAT